MTASALSLFIIAGPNGSGKTTLTEEGHLAQIGLLLPEHYINADQIASGLRKAKPDALQTDIEIEAFHAARGLREEYWQQRLSFAFETVFSHPSTLLDMQRCKSAGYRITLIYVTTKLADLNVERVAGRVRSGGHAVPEDRIRERYERSMRYLPRAFEDADHAFVFDSAQEGRTRLCVMKQRFVVPINPPEYLERRLLAVLSQREADRAGLHAFGALTQPDIESGDYTGPVGHVFSSFAIQTVSVPGTQDEIPLLHDLLLFPAEAAFQEAASAGSAVQIRYQQGAGSLVAPSVSS